MIGILQQLGVLRILLLALILIVAAMVLFMPAEFTTTGWAMVPSLIAPALVPIVFFVLLLEIMMSRIFMSDATGAKRQRFRTILTVDLLVLLILLVAWGPFFLRLIQVR